MKLCYMSLITVLLVSLFLLIGCGGAAVSDVAEDVPVQGVADGGALSESDLAMLMEVFGMSEEEIAALSPEEREIMLAEAGYDMSHKPDENAGSQNGAAAQNRTTLSDVSAGGSYVVTIGDSMLWNYLELYYENGVLQKIVAHFQKNDEEEAEVEVLEGEAARAYEFYWIDFSADPATIANELAEKVGYTSVYIESAK